MNLLNKSNRDEGASLKEPVIRERHFGLGTKRKPVERTEPKPQPKSFWSRLGFGKGKAVPEEPYKPTEILGTPVVPKPVEEKPHALSDERSTASLQAQDDEQVLKSIFGEEAFVPATPAVLPVKTAATPLPKRAAPGKTVSKKPVPAAPTAAEPEKKKRKKLDRGDLTLAALGITLGVTCAVFPWYIFFNQEKFGVREFVFEGGRGVTPARNVVYQPALVGKPFSSSDMPKMDLDFFPTATLPSPDEQMRAVPASQQPFPLDLVDYRLVHVANGRAMIEDGDGLWVVQPGSRLPDASRVVSIEQRNGGWVLLTSLDKVIELAR